MMDLQVLHIRIILAHSTYLNFLFSPQHCIKAVLTFSPNLMWAIVSQAHRSQPRSLLSTPSSFGWALKLDLQEQAPISTNSSYPASASFSILYSGLYLKIFSQKCVLVLASTYEPRIAVPSMNNLFIL